MTRLSFLLPWRGSEPDERECRRHSNDTDQRTPFQRDYDRVLYTDQFNRLSGVTQVARTGESYLYHDRQSHSLKVAQIGRRLAEHLRKTSADTVATGLSPDVVATAALAHDLGHPPFGHTVEKELDRCIRDEGIDEGFEANAQSFRIITKLAAHRPRYQGLDLTRASLNATLKYPWKRKENESHPNKFGYYRSEEADFRFAREGFDEQERSIEAQIMDWADDVAYAVHDLDDFYRGGLLPLDRIVEESEERAAFLQYIKAETDLASHDQWKPKYLLNGIGDVVQDSLLVPYSARPEQKSEMNMLTSLLIDRYMGFPGEEEQVIHIETLDDRSEPRLEINQILRLEVDLLIELTRYYIINNSSLMAQQHGQRKVVRELFHHLHEQSLPSAEYRGLVPSPYRNRIDELGEIDTHEERVRIIVDLITRLTEQQTVELYERLEGLSPGSLQDRILR